jgi:hypothetical protein
MNKYQKLQVIRFVHTLIWAFFVTVIFYILYSGIMNKVNVLTWVAVGLILAEGVVLTIFKMFCPLTIWARKYSDSQKDNFDIYLPQWLARHNKLIFTSIFIIGVLLVLYRVVL